MNTQASSSLPRRVSYGALLAASLAGDFADLFVGGMPGPWSVIINVPVTVLHFLYAGPLALVTLAEYIPLVGGLPLYTGAAVFYLLRKEKAPGTTAHAAPAAARSATVPPSQPAVVVNDPVEQRLARLAELLHKGHITRPEHDEKRKRILAEL